jgi:hypothetical protein
MSAQYLSRWHGIHWRLIGGGQGIYWSSLDEDISSNAAGG